MTKNKYLIKREEAVYQHGAVYRATRRRQHRGLLFGALFALLALGQITPPAGTAQASLFSGWTIFWVGYPGIPWLPTIPIPIPPIEPQP